MGWGDGLGSPGRVTVNYNGGEYELDVSGNFGKYANATFGEESCTTPDPTSAPTPAATSPPISDVSCNEDRELKALVIVRTDNFPDETSWAIMKPCAWPKHAAEETVTTTSLPSRTPLAMVY